MKKKVLVIGGAGFIGSNLSRHLIKNDMEVYCFDMSKPVHEIAGVNYICGDFFDDYTLEHALEGMDYVVHALSTVNPGNSNEKYLQGYERAVSYTHLEKRGLTVVSGREICYYAEALEELAKIGQVVFIEEMRKSRYNNMYQEVIRCREHQISILGMIVIGA